MTAKRQDATAARVDLESFPKAGVAVVFGASGGIRGALAEGIRAAQRFERVVAFSRNNSPSVDLLDEASLERAAAFAASKGELRLVIDATGFLHDDRRGPEKDWQQLDGVKLARSFALNAIGPALVVKHVLPRLPQAGKAVFATLSARVGSIGDNWLGGWYSYRASKAALSQLVRTAAVEFARRSTDALCISLHPGTVAAALYALRGNWFGGPSSPSGGRPSDRSHRSTQGGRHRRVLRLARPACALVIA
jgi:NAD(P)-dependent dehydrogenase (short-subunit alcohol dehydrogenase family)